MIVKFQIPPQVLFATNISCRQAKKAQFVTWCLTNGHRKLFGSNVIVKDHCKVRAVKLNVHFSFLKGNEKITRTTLRVRSTIAHRTHTRNETKIIWSRIKVGDGEACFGKVEWVHSCALQRKQQETFSKVPNISTKISKGMYNKYI